MVINWTCSKIGIDVQPIYTNKKIEQDLKLEEIKPRIVNQHSVVYHFKCDLCDLNYVEYTTRHLFQCIADHRYSAIGRHLRDAHGNKNLKNLPNLGTYGNKLNMFKNRHWRTTNLHQ